MWVQVHSRYPPETRWGRLLLDTWAAFWELGVARCQSWHPGRCDPASTCRRNVGLVPGLLGSRQTRETYSWESGNAQDHLGDTGISVRCDLAAVPCGQRCGARVVGRMAGLPSRQRRHAGWWDGLAVDLNIDGHLDNFTDGKTQLGLTILAEFFREEGWVWGAGFRREDSMHFEVSRRQL